MISRIVGGVVIAVALSACAVDPAPEATSSVEQGLFWVCDGTVMWTRHWKVNNVEVGREDCNCDGMVDHGTLTGTYTQVPGASCGGGGGGGGGSGGCFLTAPPRAQSLGATTNNLPPGC